MGSASPVPHATPGHVIYKGTELRIDGAPAMIDLENLERIIGLSVCYTDLVPWRGWPFR